MSQKLSIQEVFRINQKKIDKVLQQNGVDPTNVPPLEGTYEQRSVQRTKEVFVNNNKRINKIMRKYR